MPDPDLGLLIPGMTHYQSFRQFADQLRDQVKKIKAGEVVFQDLYENFLPKSDWDDAGGTVAIANKILDILQYLY